MPFIFIDRRGQGRGKSSTNRQKLLKRIKSFIKTALPRNIGNSGVTGSGPQQSSPVRVAASALDEPWFAYANDGQRNTVVIGNPGYDRGDTIKIPEQEESQGGGSGGEDGEDDFIVNIARDEFLDLFFEDCELPNLVHERYTDRLDNNFQQAGFSTTGNPAQLSIVRTFKQALGRRFALRAPHLEEIEELEEALAKLGYSPADDSPPDNIVAILERLQYLRAHIAALNGFDNSDLRYKKRESKPLKTVDAVLIMVMDISGSMTQGKKTIARRWFALLYAFIKRRYTNTEIIFIAHTDEAHEMSEGDFFSTRVMGGTLVSPALALVNSIIKERYDPNQTNIYVSHASDGDNGSDDADAIKEQMHGSGGLLRAVQFFNYVEVGEKPGARWYNVVKGQSTASSNSNLWEAYEEVQDESKTKNITLSVIDGADDCYGVFKKIFKKST